MVVKSINFSEDVLTALVQRAKGNLSGFLNDFLRENLLLKKKSAFGSLRGMEIGTAGLKEKKDKVDQW